MAKKKDDKKPVTKKPKAPRSQTTAADVGIPKSDSAEPASIDRTATLTPGLTDDSNESSSALEEQFTETERAQQAKPTRPARAKVACRPEPPTLPAGDELEAGRAVAHTPFYDGRVRRITAMDEPEYANQHHYMMEVQETNLDIGVVEKLHREDLHFQKGPLNGGVPNGWSEQDLVRILIDRYQNFEKFGVSQSENDTILFHLRKAHDAMDMRRQRKMKEQS